jgi:RNA polymerase sigma-70 factor (ECF subfamily)
MSDANHHPPPSTSPPAGFDRAVVAELYAQHGNELRRFVLGVVRDPELAGDVVQAAFARAAELGHTARPETIKGWLFQVAFREALTVRRRAEVRDRAVRKLASLGFRTGERPEETMIRKETIAAVRRALEELPREQSRVVWARMYEDKTFAQIAEEWGLPLGTVLTRMRLALEKMRRNLAGSDEGSE